MVFCQLANSQSLRDLWQGMKGIRWELGHLGIRKALSRNALSRQNKRRNPLVAREIVETCSFRKGIEASRVKAAGLQHGNALPQHFPMGGLQRGKGRGEDNPPPEHTIELVTNNGTWDAETTSAFYKARWQIEGFFKLIKQNLRIKSFVGLNENAVMWQIWTAMITILILQYLKSRAKGTCCNLISQPCLSVFFHVHSA